MSASECVVQYVFVFILCILLYVFVFSLFTLLYMYLCFWTPYKMR